MTSNSLGSSGDVYLFSGAGSPSAASGNIYISTGPAGTPGNVVLPGSGKLQIQDGTQGTAGYFLTSIDTQGTASWLPGPTNTLQAANLVNLASGSTTQSFTYTSAVGAGLAPVIGIIVNTVDANPIFLQAVITAYSTTGFTVRFNVAPDTANYKLPYVLTGSM